MEWDRAAGVKKKGAKSEWKKEEEVARNARLKKDVCRCGAAFSRHYQWPGGVWLIHSRIRRGFHMCADKIRKDKCVCWLCQRLTVSIDRKTYAREGEEDGHKRVDEGVIPCRNTHVSAPAKYSSIQTPKILFHVLICLDTQAMCSEYSRPISIDVFSSRTTAPTHTDGTFGFSLSCRLRGDKAAPAVPHRSVGCVWNVCFIPLFIDCFLSLKVV